MLLYLTNKQPLFLKYTLSEIGRQMMTILPLDIKPSPNVNIFKKKLKTHLFSKAYSAAFVVYLADLGGGLD